MLSLHYIIQFIFATSMILKLIKVVRTHPVTLKQDNWTTIANELNLNNVKYLPQKSSSIVKYLPQNFIYNVVYY